MRRWIMGAGIVVGAIIVASVVAIAFGERTWRRATEAAFARVTARAASTPAAGLATTFAAGMLDSLPAPVARYFRFALIPSVRMIRAAYIDHAGEFALSPGQWRAFTSRQVYTTAPRAFVWDATIRMMPFVPVFVRDRYVDGQGSMLGAIGGTMTVVDHAGTPELARGALLRFLAEAAWLPTALLPTEGVTWTAIDDSTARATITDAGNEVSMDVHFRPNGSIERISAMRDRDVRGAAVLTPWVGAFSEETMTVSGMKIPVSGHVKWILPEGEHAYWRGTVVAARYEFR